MPYLAPAPPDLAGSAPPPPVSPPPATAPGYDPAQDTQGMQAQPAPITTAPPTTDPATSAEASYQQGLYNQQIAQPGPEYDTQSIASPPSAPPATTPYGPPASQGQTLNAPPPYQYDRQVPFPGPDTPPELPADRLRQRVGTAGSWFDTPTTPGSVNAPPPDNPHRGETNLLQGALGVGKFLANYGPGGRAPYSLPETVARDFAPWSPENAKALTDSMQPQSPTALPDWMRWAVATGRYLWYDQPQATPYAAEAGGGGDNPMDQTDAWLGNDPTYLRYMASMPAYLTPLRPLAAQVAHQIAKAPGPSWQPPYIPGTEPGSTPDSLAPDAPREGRWYPDGTYYDDPYIPGPDKRRGRRRTA
jgi:hypothetical protein